jgi:hypothetical protein
MVKALTPLLTGQPTMLWRSRWSGDGPATAPPPAGSADTRCCCASIPPWAVPSLMPLCSAGDGCGLSTVGRSTDVNCRSRLVSPTWSARRGSRPDGALLGRLGPRLAARQTPPLGPEPLGVLGTVLGGQRQHGPADLAAGRLERPRRLVGQVQYQLHTARLCGGDHAKPALVGLEAAVGGPPVTACG